MSGVAVRMTYTWTNASTGGPSVYTAGPAVFTFQCACRRQQNVQRIGRLNLIIDCPCGLAWVVIIDRARKRARLERLREMAS